MPQQLIYTSAPRGIVAGRSGYCTVARSASMREALVLPLEKLCYYQHLSLSGGQERPIFACRIIDLRGTRFHVLTRIQDAGLDFTGRTNFVAHHLVFTPEEIKQFPPPPAILRDWPGWAKSWTKDAQLLESENWTELIALATKTNIPAQTWQRVTGDAVNGYGLLEARAGASFRVDDHPTETVLGLFAESVELLEVRDTRRDFRTAGWQFTFTTSIQEQDNPADFRWRCIHSDNPTATRFAGPDCRALSSVRAGRCTPEETAFARSGRQPPRFVTEPQDVRLVEGETARFQVKAEGIPQPIYQWFSVDRHDNGQIIEGQNGPDLTVATAPLGKSRYVVRASNSAGETTTNVVTLSVEQKLRVAKGGFDAGALREPVKVGTSHLKSEDDIERQRKRLQAEQAEEKFRKRARRNTVIFAILGILLVTATSVYCWIRFFPRKTALSKHESAENSHLSNNNSLVTDSSTATSNSLPTNDNHGGKSELKPVSVNAGPQYPMPQEWHEVVIGAGANLPTEYFPDVKPRPRFDLNTGADGFHGNGDNVLFVHKTNFITEFEAAIHPETNATPRTTSKGIMIRESTAGNSPFLFIGIFNQQIVTWSRDYTANLHPMEYITHATNTDLISKPIYLKIFKNNDNQLEPMYSLDQKKWIKSSDVPALKSCAIPAGERMFGGFALFSGTSSSSATAHFSEMLPSNDPAKKQ
jgi:hypothetical protein